MIASTCNSAFLTPRHEHHQGREPRDSLMRSVKGRGLRVILTGLMKWHQCNLHGSTKSKKTYTE